MAFTKQQHHQQQKKQQQQLQSQGELTFETGKAQMTLPAVASGVHRVRVCLFSPSLSFLPSC